jgi:hypothetical protein
VLLANLFFSQVALNFFHHHEEEKEVISAESIKSLRGNDKLSGQNPALYKKHQESCKVCDLHLFHELYADELSLFDFLPKDFPSHYNNHSESFLGIYSGCGSDRAPPVHSSLS